MFRISIAFHFLAITAFLFQTDCVWTLQTIRLVPYHVHRERVLREGGSVPELERPIGRRRLQSEVSALYQGYGTHYADLWCGTPPQRQTVIVDTGSGVTAFPCDGCNDCGDEKYHTDRLFMGKDSSTYRVLGCQECLKGSCRGGAKQCQVGMSYAEGSSWSAKEVSDRCYVGGMHNSAVERETADNDWDPHHAAALAFDLKFGCQTRLTGLFKTQLADGIMGMDVAKASFWQQLYDAGKVTTKNFALCFARYDHVSREGTEAGAMTLGGVEPRLHKAAMVFAQSDSFSRGFYNVHIRKIYLRQGGAGDSIVPNGTPDLKALNLDEKTLGNVIVDSGTTDSYFSSAWATEFKKVWKELTNTDFDNNARTMTKEQVDAMPTIIFQLSGATERNQEAEDTYDEEHLPGLARLVDPDHPMDVLIAVPPSHYMEYDTKKLMYQARFYVTESHGGVIGANMMMGHDVYFDIEESNVGWAESSCSYTAAEKEFYGSNPDDKPAEPPSVPTPEDDDDDDDDDAVDDDDDDDDDNTNIEPAFEADEENKFCSTLNCQMSFLAAVLLGVLVAAVRVFRRTPNVDYELAELEMNETNKANVAPEGTGYSDDDKLDGELG